MICTRVKNGKTAVLPGIGEIEHCGKGGFFSESVIRFSYLQISKKNIPKNYPELEI